MVDLDPWAAMNADPEVREFFGTTLTRERSAASMRLFRRELAERGWGWWALEVAATGEFICVAKFGADGAQRFRDFYRRRKAQFWGQPYREAPLFQKAYLIHMFQDMIEHGTEFGHADTPGHYREIDTQQDMDLAQTLWNPPT